MLKIEKPTQNEFTGIRQVLSQWTFSREVRKYSERIRDEIAGRSKYNMQFWVAKENGRVIGIAGLGESLPKEMSYAQTEIPCSLKILYVHGDHQGKGIGTILITFIEQQAKKQGYDEILVRSAERYRGSSYGFYEKRGYRLVGETGQDENKMAVFQKILG